MHFTFEFSNSNKKENEIRANYDIAQAINEIAKHEDISNSSQNTIIPGNRENVPQFDQETSLENKSSHNNNQIKMNFQEEVRSKRKISINNSGRS